MADPLEFGHRRGSIRRGRLWRSSPFISALVFQRAILTATLSGTTIRSSLGYGWANGRPSNVSVGTGATGLSASLGYLAKSDFVDTVTFYK